MAKNFTFASRVCGLTFFDEAPLTVTIPIGAETDQKIDSAMRVMLESDKKDAEADKVRKGKDALRNLLGEKSANAILQRADRADSYAIWQVLIYVRAAYVEEKAKNLYGSLARG